jgi:hypothetical protein
MKSIALSGLVAAALPRAVCAVRADAKDPKALIEQINAAFEEFKSTNDAAPRSGKRGETPSPRMKSRGDQHDDRRAAGCLRRAAKEAGRRRASAWRPQDRGPRIYEGEWSAYVRGNVESSASRLRSTSRGMLRAASSRRPSGTARHRQAREDLANAPDLPHAVGQRRLVQQAVQPARHGVGLGWR